MIDAFRIPTRISYNCSDIIEYNAIKMQFIPRTYLAECGGHCFLTLIFKLLSDIYIVYH